MCLFDYLLLCLFVYLFIWLFVYFFIVERKMTTLTLIVLLTAITCYNEATATSSREYKTAFTRSTRKGLMSHVTTSNFAVSPQSDDDDSLPGRTPKKKGGKRATIVTVKSCNAEFCDPGWEPYPNIVSTVTGYNILKGNPYNLGTEQDPGFETGYIFVPVVKDDDDRYALHSGITIRAISKCDLSMNTKVVSTVQGYQDISRKVVGKFEGWKTNPPVEVSAKGVSAELPPLIDAFAAGNDALKEHAAFFSERRGVLTINDATCAVYAMQISRRNPPPFQQPFKNAVTALSKAPTEKRQEEFRKFIQEFGTHYVQKATVGARLSIVRRYSRERFRQATEDTIEKCNKHRLAYFYVKEQSEDNCTSLENEGESMIFNSIQKEQIISYGSKPSDSLTDWANQEFESPVPIKMTLTPIIDLFDANFMGIDDDLRDLDYPSVKGWMTDLYANYCEDMKSDLGIELCQPGDVQRCGYNDKCNPAYEDCVQTSDIEYKCVTKVTKEVVKAKVREAMGSISTTRSAKEVAKLIDRQVFSKLHGFEGYVIAKEASYGKMRVAGETAGMVETDSFHVAFAWASFDKVGRGQHFQRDAQVEVAKVRCTDFDGSRGPAMTKIIQDLNNKGHHASFFIQVRDEERTDLEKTGRTETMADYDVQTGCHGVNQYILVGPGRG